MKKKILCIVVCLAMTVSILAGCGAGGEGGKNSRKLEKEYLERMEAYQEYFDQIKTDYSDYEIGGTITLDSEGLPLLWMIIYDSESSGNVYSTQMIGVEKKKAKVLAERSSIVYPYRGQVILAVGESGGDQGDNFLYIYMTKKNKILLSSMMHWSL